VAASHGKRGEHMSKTRTTRAIKSRNGGNGRIHFSATRLKTISALGDKTGCNQCSGRNPPGRWTPSFAGGHPSCIPPVRSAAWRGFGRRVLFLSAVQDDGGQPQDVPRPHVGHIEALSGDGVSKARRAGERCCRLVALLGAEDAFQPCYGALLSTTAKKRLGPMGTTAVRVLVPVPEGRMPS
jgi:hypothetical protein